MTPPKVLSRKQLPTRYPVLQTLILYFILDRYHAQGWVWGAVGLLAVLIWAACIHRGWTEKEIELKELS